MKKTDFMKLYYNKTTMNIAYNPILCNKTKNVETDKHFIKEKLQSSFVCILFVINTRAIRRYHYKRLIKTRVSLYSKQVGYDMLN